MGTSLVDTRAMPPVPGHPRIGLALGGGGARGLAHIIAIEALDEMGLRPAAIAGTSIGAMFGAAMAAGHPAAYLRAHVEETLSQRLALVRQLFTVRARPVEKLLSLFPMRAALLDAEALLDIVLPARMPATFAGLEVSLDVVATDFHAQEAVTLSEGPLRQAIAASIALPVIFQPVTIAGRVLMDGGLADPLPYDRLTTRTDLVIAIDVSGAGRAPGTSPVPGAIEALASASQILQRSIVREKLRSSSPDILIEMPSPGAGVLEFHRWREILEAAEPAREQLKRQIARVLSAQNAEVTGSQQAAGRAP